MKAPRNLKQALEQDFVVTKVYYKGDKKCRVDLRRRFHRAGQVDFVSFWISSKYVARTYPGIFERGTY